MKFVGINIILGFALAILSHHLHAQTGCWNDKKMPKEWFVAALVGYTFGYGGSENRPAYKSTDYSNWDDSSYSEEIENLKNVYAQDGSHIGLGGGIYFNKAIGLILTAGYFWGKHFERESISIRSNFNSPSLYQGELNDYRYSSSNNSFYYRSWSLCPTLLYRIALSKGYVYSLLGVAYGRRTYHSTNEYREKRYFRGALVNEQASRKDYVDMEKFMFGIVGGLGYCYPIGARLEIMVQAALNNQRYINRFRQLLIGGYSSNDGIAISAGVRYNLRPANIFRP